MARITNEIAIRHTRARVLVMAGAGAELSAFELELIEEIARRRAAFGDAACVTAAEADVIGAAVEAMETAIRSAFAALSGKMPTVQGLALLPKSVAA